MSGRGGRVFFNSSRGHGGGRRPPQNSGEPRFSPAVQPEELQPADTAGTADPVSNAASTAAEVVNPKPVQQPTSQSQRGGGRGRGYGRGTGSGFAHGRLPPSNHIEVDRSMLERARRSERQMLIIAQLTKFPQYGPWPRKSERLNVNLPASGFRPSTGRQDTQMEWEPAQEPPVPVDSTFGGDLTRANANAGSNARNKSSGYGANYSNSRVFYNSSRKRPNPNTNAKQPDTNPNPNQSQSRNTTRRRNPYGPRDRDNGESSLESGTADSPSAVEVEVPVVENSPTVDKEPPAPVPEIPAREPLDCNSIDEPELKVLNNELIFDNIASYLDQPTLKVLSGTCTWLKELTRRCRKFVDCTKLNIHNQPTMQTKNVGILKGFSFPWKTLSLVVDNWKTKQLKILKEICGSGSVEILELYSLPGNMEKPSVSHSDLSQLILRPHTLRSLSLDGGLLSRDYFSKVMSNKVKRQLAELESLSIVPGLGSTDEVIELSEVYNKNLTSLFSVPNMQLKSFVLHRVEPPLGYQPEASERFSLIVVKLLERNAATLQNLTLHGQVWTEDKMKTIVFPSLESLNVRINARNSQLFGTFLDNQPLLQSLTLRLTNPTRPQVLPLDAIRRRSAKLKTLRICWVIKNVEFPAEHLDWNFLSGLQHLEDVEIRQGLSYSPGIYLGGGGNSLAEILPQIPGSVKSVRVNGAETDGWIRVAEDSISCFSRYSNLSQLSLLNCLNSISDPVLQYICSNMSQLTTFEFGKCHEVTDFGLTGRRGTENSGISLLNLRGLRKLGIHGCIHITSAAVKSVIEFLELKELSLTPIADWGEFSTESIVEIGRKNPSLEMLTITFPLPALLSGATKTNPETWLRAELEKCVPRLKELTIKQDEELPVSEDEYSFVDEDSEWSTDVDSDVSGFGPHDFDAYDYDRDSFDDTDGSEDSYDVHMP